MTKQETQIISQALKEFGDRLINSFDSAIDHVNGIEIDYANENMCRRHLKVDCMCDEPYE